MEEPILKKKSFLNRIIANQLFITMFSTFLMLFVIVGSSYALFNDTAETLTNDVTVSSGNLQVIIASSSDMLTLNYETLGVSDEVGLENDPYTFTIKNTGDGKIAYYEIRIVDKEYEISTLPHKSINFAIQRNGDDYNNPQNLGDNRSYIYAGNNLDIGDTDTFNLKLWVNEEFGRYANNKDLKASIELTLYNEVPTRHYLIYNTMGGGIVTKTSVSSKRVTEQVPVKDGYVFVGWSEDENSTIANYQSGDVYNKELGDVLYAVWRAK